MHDDRTGSLLDAVALSVNDRIDYHLKHHSIRCKSKVHFDTIVLKLNSIWWYCTKTDVHNCMSAILTNLVLIALFYGQGAP